MLIRVVPFSISIVMVLILFFGCSATGPDPQEMVQEDLPTRLRTLNMQPVMYVTQDTPLFMRGEAVTIEGIEGAMARTSKGLINIALLEKTPSKVRLKIQAPQGSHVRIMNIGPKYYDGIYLKPGSYLVEVSKEGYQKHSKWIKLEYNTKINIALKPVPKAESVSFLWHYKAIKDYNINLDPIAISGTTLWQDKERSRRYQWNEAQSLCLDTRISLSKHYWLEKLRLPSVKEFEALQTDALAFKYTAMEQFDYWTSNHFTPELLKRIASYNKGNQEHNSNHRVQLTAYNNEGRFEVAEVSLRNLEHTANVMCVAEKMNFLDATLQALQQTIYDNNSAKESNNQKRTDALREAFHLKYGAPVIHDVVCHKNTGRCTVIVAAQRNRLEQGIEVAVDEKEYDDFIMAVHSTIALNPVATVEIVNNTPKIIALDALKNVEELLMRYRFDAAYFSAKKLQQLIDAKALDTSRTKRALMRIKALEKMFQGKVLDEDMILDGCHYYYPKGVINVNTVKELNVEFWDEISGKISTCKDGLASGKTTLYFFSEKGIYVKLKGEMQQGLFTGIIKYENSQDPTHSVFKKQPAREVDMRGIDTLKR